MTGSCCHLQTLCFLCSALVILQGNINIMWPRMPHSEAKSGVSSHWIRNLQGGISLVVVKTGSFHYKGWRFDPWLGKFHMPEKTKTKKKWEFTGAIRNHGLGLKSKLELEFVGFIYLLPCSFIWKILQCDFNEWKKVKDAQSCLCDPMDYSLPDFSVPGISQVRILEWVAISFSKGSSWPRDPTWVSCIIGRLFYYLSHQGRLWLQ